MFNDIKALLIEKSVSVLFFNKLTLVQRVQNDRNLAIKGEQLHCVLCVS